MITEEHRFSVRLQYSPGELGALIDALATWKNSRGEAIKASTHLKTEELPAARPGSPPKNMTTIASVPDESSGRLMMLELLPESAKAASEKKAAAINKTTE